HQTRMCRKRFHEVSFSSLQVADIYKMTGDGGGRGHRGTDEMSTSAASLAALKIAIAGRGTAFAFAKPITIHGNTHAAACFTPFETSLAEDICQTLFFSHAAYTHRTRDHNG